MTQEEKRLYYQEYRKKNKDKIKAIKQKSYIKNKEYYDNYWATNKDKKLEYDKTYSKQYYEENKDNILNKRKILSSSPEYKNKRNTQLKERRDTDHLYRLKVNIRSLISHSLNRKGYIKNCKTFEILGCSYQEFKIYLESKFEHWMTWDNYGLYDGNLNTGWDIDHITPNANATNEAEIFSYNHYTNLQPLCSKVNRDIKKNNIS